jgi:hypothetical protein
VPRCCGRAEQEESERVAALVDVARSHQPFTYWRRAAIERIFIDIAADHRREDWKAHPKRSAVKWCRTQS